MKVALAFLFTIAFGLKVMYHLGVNILPAAQEDTKVALTSAVLTA